jgi:hypothetical protein
MKKTKRAINEVELNNAFQRLTGLDPEEVEQLEVKPSELGIGKLQISLTNGIEISNISMSWRVFLVVVVVVVVVVVTILIVVALFSSDVNLSEMFAPANSQANRYGVTKV